MGNPWKESDTLIIPWKERRLAVLVAVQVFLMVWAIGGVFVWTQLISLGIGFSAFILALANRQASERMQGISPAGYLIRMPWFWAGLLWMLYVLIQYLNPAFSFVAFPEEKRWAIKVIDNVAWLPSGTDAPFSYSNPLRVLVVWSGAIFSAWALLIGIQFRRTLIMLLWILSLGSIVYATVGLVQVLTESREILWRFRFEGGFRPVATFLYKNHGAEFLNLMLGLNLGMALRASHIAKRRMLKSNPGPLFLLGAGIISALVFFSWSRAGIVFAGLLWLIFLFIFALRFFRRGFFTEPGSIILIILCLGASVGIVSQLPWKTVIERMETVIPENAMQDGSLQSRFDTYAATWEMHQDRPWLGWGAGSFRYLFRAYQKEIQEPEHQWTRRDRQNMFWTHAHSDYLEILIEYGWIGSILLATALISLFWTWLLSPLMKTSYAWMWLATPLVMLAHAIIDFPLQNPAILLTFAVLMGTFSRLGILERARYR